MKTTKKVDLLVTECDLCGAIEEGCPGGWFKTPDDETHLCNECMELVATMTRNRGRPRDTGGLEALFR